MLHSSEVNTPASGMAHMHYRTPSFPLAHAITAAFAPSPHLHHMLDAVCVSAAADAQTHRHLCACLSGQVYHLATAATGHRNRKRLVLQTASTHTNMSP